MRLFTVAFLYLASLQVLEFRHVGNEIHTATTSLKRTRRSMLIVQCCNSEHNSQTCWPTRKRPQAIATITNGGVEVQCPGCPANWRSNLNWEGYGGTGIQVFCPGCAANWRENLDISMSPKHLFISTKHPGNSTKHNGTTSSKTTVGDTDGTDATDENGSTTTVKHSSSNSTKTSLHSNSTLTTNGNVTSITTISTSTTSSNTTTTKPR